MKTKKKDTNKPEKQDTNKPKKYYYNTMGLMKDTCTERCNVKNNGIMIGSAACQEECEYCTESHNHISTWIRCLKLEEALTGKKE